MKFYKFKYYFLTSLVISALILFSITISLEKSVFYNKNKRDYYTIKRSEYEVISPVGDDKNNKSEKESNLIGISYELKYLMNVFFANWNKIFDIISYNISFNLKYRDFNPQKLESLTQKVKLVRKFFRPGDLGLLVDNYGSLIVEECNRYNLDWRLILSMIHQESYFNPEAVSRAGAYGFMQIMPGTGSGLQKELNLEDTRAPKNNLIAGIYYYATLVASFEFTGDDKYKFALASYNAGLGRVVDAMTITYYYGKDYNKWDYVKEYLPYLSSSFDSVHSVIWPSLKRPPSGTLNNWREPYYYVEYISYYYSEYKKIYESNLVEKETPKRKKSKRKNA